MAVPYTFGTATSSIPLSQLDSNFATVITLGNTAIQLGNTVTTLNNMTLANVTISSGNVTITNVTITTANVTTANIGTAFVSGNVSFTSTGNRITGDFSNATFASRVVFQTSTVNGATQLSAIPNGTGTVSTLQLYNNSDIANSSRTNLAIISTEARLSSDITGTGTYLPMAFSAGGSEAMRIAVAAGGIRAVGIGYTTLTGVGDNGLAVLGNVGIGTNSPAPQGATSKSKLTLAKSAQSTIGESSYLHLGGSEAGVGTHQLISFGYNVSGLTNFPAYIGYENTNLSGNTKGDLIFGTRDVGTDTSPSERMRIDSAGIVTMSAYGAGAATFSAAGVISSVSDETWKIKDGVPVDPDSMLKKLEPGYWYYNDEKKETFGVDRQLGFYAQNVNAAIGPEAAPTPEEGKPWGYYDRSVLAVTVMSLQKALATIESLTARIEALEST